MRVEPIIYNGGYWKLHQISSGCDFSKYLPEKFMVKGVVLNFVANNVLMLKKWLDHINSEGFISNAYITDLTSNMIQIIR